MNPVQEELRHSYGFSDFLFYTCLLMVPLVTAFTVIAESSPWLSVIYLLAAVCSGAVIMRFFCTKCPHYHREKKLLTCIFFWQFPKVFKPRREGLSNMDKIITVAASGIVLFFPLYWLIGSPGFLLVYVLSMAGLGAAIHRNECRRCIFSDCPLNRV